MTIINGEVATSNASIITAGAGETWGVIDITFCNTTGSTVTLSLKSLPSGGSAKFLVKDFSILAADTFIWSSTEKFLLGAGDAIQASASGAGLDWTATYLLM